MVEYRTRGLTITQRGLFVRGIPFPFLSRMELEWSDVVSVECVPCTIFHRGHAFGPDFLGQWWGFDPKRLIRKTALKLVLRDGVFSFSTLMFTGDDMEGAERVASGILAREANKSARP